MLKVSRALAVAFVFVLGCGKISQALKGAAADDSATPASSTSPTSAIALDPPRIETIADPSLGMNAFELKIPGNWHFEGTLLQNGNCVGTPFPVFRMTSPDGLSFVERLPVLGWAWGTGFAAKVDHGDCLPIKEAMSAQDFLKYLSSTLEVEYVKDDPVPPEIDEKAQKALSDAIAMVAPKYAAMHVEPPKQTRTVARAIVRYLNGTFAMKGRLTTLVDCTETKHAGMKSILRGMADTPSWVGDQCNATVQYISAPENQLDALVAKFDSEELQSRGAIPEWSQAWVARNQRESEIAIQHMRDESNARLRASAAQFAHDQAVRQHMHEQFLATMQRGTDMSMNRARQIANSNHRAAQDWVDYSLDRKTVRDPGTGQISKVSSAQSYTWIDSSGKTSYQTNDPNANPNGSLKGTWTRQQVVHGDGTN